MRPLTLDLVDFLRTDQARQALSELLGDAPGESATLQTLARLRQRFPPEQAAALLDQARLRQRAGEKFPRPELLLFDAEALQQASSRAVATYRAQQFSRYRRVADLGCGIGADSIALAEAGLAVLAVEINPIRARIARYNVSMINLAGRVEVHCADWTGLLWLPLRERAGVRVDAAFVDPGRRAHGRRIFDLAQMEPPIAAVHALRKQLPDVAVKTAPGIADADIPADSCVEFISERGQMKEALLRFGGLHLEAARTATLLPGPYQLDSNAPAGDAPVGQPLAFLYEPDPAVIRATLVRQLAGQLGAAQLDPAIAYLTAERLVETPFARAWQVLRHGPFHLKTLNRWLRDLQAGEVIVKKRGSAIDPDPFRRRLKTTPGGRPLTLFLTRVQDRPWMIVAIEMA